ncbi:MAG: DUF3558 domain-containing protein [Actinomycetota bacterium]|nr:DUF3558 domain-containing protein [Actinomycetota bacterium]
MTSHTSRAAMIGAGVTATCLLATACSGGSTSTATTSNPPIAHTSAYATTGAQPTTAAALTSGADPCSLLTQNEVDTAAGQPLGPGKKTSAPGDCQWTTSDFAAAVNISLGDWAAIKAAATGGTHQPTTIAGIGDEALNLNGSNGSLLYIRKGNTGFLLELHGPRIDAAPDHGLAQEKVLAEAALSRL